MGVAEHPQPLTGPRPAVRWRLLVAFSAAIPLLTIFVWLCLLYGWEAWGNLTPWVVPDEFERAQLSRAIATTGHAAQRGVPHSFGSLYAYLIAPAWWIDDTTRAYGVVKTIGVATMTAVLFPTYLLARTLVSKRWALFAASGAAVIPTLAYSSLLMLEPLAYLWAGLSFYLLAKAFVTRRPGWIVAAAIACLLAPSVRGELGVMTGGAVVAAFVFWFTGDGGRRLRRNWARVHWAGFAVVAVAAAVAADLVAENTNGTWHIATQHKGLMITYALRAAGALTIGLGVFPTVAGLTALVKHRRERPSREVRALVSLTGTMIASFMLYTAGKSAFLVVSYSANGQPFLAERNLIYLAPLLFVATALLFERGHPPLAAVAVATAAALYLVIRSPYLLGYRFFFDAPGLSVLQSLSRNASLTPNGAKVVLILLALASGAVLASGHFLRGSRASFVIALAAAFVLAWNVYGEITFSRSSHAYSNQLLDNIPKPVNWIDRAVPDGAQVYYLGQSVNQSVPFGSIQLLEFWNRSLQHVWSTDDTAPGPGPSVVPDVIRRDGQLAPAAGVRYMLADFGITLVGRVLETKNHLGGGIPVPWTLYRLTPPVRIRQSVEGLYSDGWGEPKTALNQYSLPDGARSVLRISLSRYVAGQPLPTTVRVKVGTLAIGNVLVGRSRTPAKGPIMGKVLFTRTLHVPSNLDRVFTFELPAPPFRVETSVTAFVPRVIDPRSNDGRELGARTSYSVTPVLPG